jgi:hypothetical protein
MEYKIYLIDTTLSKIGESDQKIFICKNMEMPKRYVIMDKFNELLTNQKKVVQMIWTMLKANINNLCLRPPKD